MNPRAKYRHNQQTSFIWGWEEEKWGETVSD